MDEKKQEKQIPTVELGGRLWELRFTHKVMKAFSRATRCSLSDFDRAFDDYDNQVLLIWLMLTAQDPSVTRQQLDDWLDELILEDVFRIGEEAISAALPSTAGKRLAERTAAREQAEEAEDPLGEITSTDP